MIKKISLNLSSFTSSSSSIEILKPDLKLTETVNFFEPIDETEELKESLRALRRYKKIRRSQ